jgi:hypothetical protein
MATTTTNFGWDIPQSTDLVKDGATAIAALGQDIDTALVDLKGGTTGQVLAKASNTDLDYSWVAQDDSNAIQNAIVDAKGDLIAATANDTPARLAVGANDTILIADSTAATGLAWKTATTQFPWITWTPTYGGITIGNGTVQAKYQQIGKTVNFYWKLIFGSTSSVGSDPYFALPVTKAVTGYIFHEGNYTDASSGTFSKGFGVNTGTLTYLYVLNTAGTYAAASTVSSTVPFTLAVNDELFISGSYEGL